MNGRNQKDSKERPDLRAAGGVLIREGAAGKEIAVIYRSRYKEWALPKGKPEENEALLEAALREVQEETGYQASPVRFLGTTSYLHSGRPKTVSFWVMSPIGESRFRQSEEVEKVEWMTIEDALRYLKHEEERLLLQRLLEDDAQLDSI